MARFDLAAADDGSLVAWYRDRELPRLRKRLGFRAARLCRRGPPHPTAPSRDPRWMALVEWDGVMTALADGTAQEAADRHEAAFPGHVSQFLYSVGRRTFRLAATDGGGVVTRG
jgi:hypothetical protein